ncbi:MAG TPA: chemotaxis protein CheW [Pseudolabrys sp.]|nr:chemotaxis protein CheW [Pseudolabrys sp.]
MNAPKLDRPLEVLTMALQGQTFALEAAHVREILDVVPVTEVPGSQPYVSGIINVRGKVVPLADLRLKFGMEQKPDTIDTRIVVIEVDLDRVPTIVGLRADKVYEVTELAPSALADVPRVGMRWRPEYIRYIGKRGDDFIVVPDIARILSPNSAEPAIDNPTSDRRTASLAVASH